MTAHGIAEGTRLLPDDEHDRALLSLVHPPDWTNPVPRGAYHLVVVGAGTGGLVTAAAAAGLGARVALVERHLMGGDCLNAGCVPSKAVISAARTWDAGPKSFAAVMTRMRRLRASLAQSDSAPRFRDLGVDVYLGTARFTSQRTVEVAGAPLRFHRAVIATGARPAVPGIPGLAESGFFTNESIFTLTELPETLAVIGGGPIGCELAQAFQRLGARVTLLGSSARLLPRDDAEAATVVATSLARDGVRIVTGARVSSLAPAAGGQVIRFTSPEGDGSVTAAAILVAAGRSPNVEDLGLEQAAVRVSGVGVVVDDHLRTSNPRIFAVGDVCSRLRFTHAADAQARLVVQNALFPVRSRASRLVVPWCTYTSPELAHVGLTEGGASAAGVAVDVVRVEMGRVDRAVLEGEEEGFAKVLLARGTDRIVGATVVAAHAGEMISEVSLAMTNGLGLAALGRTIHPYPTRAEVLRKLADTWRRGKLTPMVKWVLGRWLSLRGP